MNRGRVQFIDEDAINDSLSNVAVVLGLQIDIAGVRVERLATQAFGDVLTVVNLSPQLLLKCDRTNEPNANSLASSESSTPWARSLSRMARISYRLAGCFLASMPDSLVLSRQKTQIEAIRLFRVHTSSNMVAFSEKCR